MQEELEKYKNSEEDVLRLKHEMVSAGVEQCGPSVSVHLEAILNCDLSVGIASPSPVAILLTDCPVGVRALFPYTAVKKRGNCSNG